MSSAQEVKTVVQTSKERVIGGGMSTKKFNTNVQISDSPFCHFVLPLGQRNEGAELIHEEEVVNLKRISKVGCQIIEGISTIGGIIEAFIYPHKLSVTKDERISWDELEPQILKILNTICAKRL